MQDKTQSEIDFAFNNDDTIVHNPLNTTGSFIISSLN